MTPLERLEYDTRRTMREAAGADVLERVRLRSLVGAPPRPVRLRGDAGRLAPMVGGGGAAGAWPSRDGLAVPPDLAGFQAGYQARPHTHAPCCGCRKEIKYKWNQGLSGLIPVTGGLKMVDAHAHLFGATYNDYLAAAAGDTTTDTWQRILWLTDDMGAAGIRRMVVSGLSDTTVVAAAGDHVVGGDGYSPVEVNWPVELAVTEFPDYFLPLINTSMRDGNPAGSLDADRAVLGSQWAGIGEIIVHGHQSDYSETDPDNTEKLQNLMTLAGEMDVPIVFHWDMGAVDDEASRSAQANYEQFVALLDEFPDVKVVLAHCGLGPWNDTSSAELNDWKDRLTTLAERRNLYFDIGGMQLSPPVQPVHQLMEGGDPVAGIGDVILTLIATHPKKFMWGTDVETRSASQIYAADSPDLRDHPGIDTYAASVSEYLSFFERGVSKGYISEGNLIFIKQWNAERVFGA